MSKKNLVIVAVIAIVILGFILLYGKTVAPTIKETVNVQSEIDRIANENKIQTSYSAVATKKSPKAEIQSENDTVENNVDNNANNTNNNPMQLEIKITQTGTGEKMVKSGDTIGVYYTGKLTDGKVFDSNASSGKPFEFKVGAGMVIQGWEQGFIDAKIGEKRTLTIPANLGYGVQGAGSSIPPNATLIFDVELVSIK